jgi:hypothetical protein
MNVPDRNEPIQPHPEQAKAVIRIFELYSRGDMTFELLTEKLAAEGHVYQPCQPRFPRTALSYILNNRSYLGEIVWHKETYPGKHRPLIDRATFQLCQDILNGKNRRTGKPEIPLSGGLFTCAHCGCAITGERIRRRLNGGGINEHVYYRCAKTTLTPTTRESAGGRLIWSRPSSTTWPACGCRHAGSRTGSGWPCGRHLPISRLPSTDNGRRWPNGSQNSRT